MKFLERSHHPVLATDPPLCFRYGQQSQRRWETPMELFWASGLIELPRGPPREHGAPQGGSGSPLKEFEGQITACKAPSRRARCTFCFPGHSLLRHCQKYQNTISTASRIKASLRDSKTNVSYSAAWSGLVGAWICLAGTHEEGPLHLPSLRNLANPFSLSKELDHTQPLPPLSLPNTMAFEWNLRDILEGTWALPQTSSLGKAYSLGQ